MCFTDTDSLQYENMLGDQDVYDFSDTLQIIPTTEQ